MVTRIHVTMVTEGSSYHGYQIERYHGYQSTRYHG